MYKKIRLLLIIAFCLITSAYGQLAYDGYLQTRKLFLFGSDNGFEYTEFNTSHNFQFEREFDNVPRVGLALYTLDFEYSPDFSSRITADTNRTATAIRINSMSQNANNRLYIMYIATDNVQLGIFVPDRLGIFLSTSVTDQLSLPTRTQSQQTFDFNFKEEVTQLAKAASDITLTVYLTGISTTSEMSTNGFPANRTSISLKVNRGVSTRFYSVQVSIGADYPFILVDWVECTVVYFIPSVLMANRYQMNSGAVTLKAFGGSRDPVKNSVDLVPLQEDSRFEDLSYFFGISTLECRDGTSITLLGVEKYYTSQTDSSIRLLLQMETWKLTYIETSTFNYIQYKSLKCTEPGANCPEVCSEGPRPFYMLQDQCNYCHYSCLTCNVSNLDTVCDTCDQTRTLNQLTRVCECKPQYFETFQNYSCSTCFPCRTCDAKNTCTTCLQSQFMVLNTVTSLCLCQQGYYANLKNKTYVQTQPCLPCDNDCLYCLSATQCVACSMNTYLHEGACLPLCNDSQRYNQTGQKCSAASLAGQFDQLGRLGFDWNYRIQENEMIIDLIFSQTDMQFFYSENGTAYNFAQYKTQQANGGVNSANGSGSNSFFYDDGINSNGYPTHQDTGSGASTSVVDESALLGEYYGYGETAFFSRLYENSSAKYRDQYGIPYGKYTLKNNSNIANPNYVDALSRNLVFKISDEVIPYTMEGVSDNRFIMRTRPGKTFINSLASIEIKNPALVRSNQTALQQTLVSKEIPRFDHYSASQLNSAHSLCRSNETLVDILWGLCKYLLFVGLGWPLLPLMMAMQYIMSFNYIQTPLPLNLDCFLASFRDFRNPSILYNPMRNNMDRDVLSHSNLYRSEPVYEEFDRGLDFMKNSFQFFFVPFLAVILLGLLALLNLLFRKCCKKDFCLISKYLMPRLPLLIGAYTLVQALPVSFFFFGQLKDISWRHPLQPNGSYMPFNMAMAFLAFFLTCAIPILLLAGLYYVYNYGSRISRFSDANVFNKRFLNKIQHQPENTSRAHLGDPLWGGNATKPSTYVFGFALFGLAILFGFFLAFFVKSFAWQLAGIILFTVLMLVFLVAAGFFTSKVFKIFFVVFFGLMLAYLLLHAGLGSNRSVNTYDQWNTGYLGIGLLYALLLAALLFSAYLFYRMFRSFYKNHKKYGCWTSIDKEHQVANDDNGKEVARVLEYRNDTKLKSAFLKTGIYGSGIGASGIGATGTSNMIGSPNNNPNLGYNVSSSNYYNSISPPVQGQIQGNADSAEHMIANRDPNLWEQLNFRDQNPNRNEINYVSSKRQKIFEFPLNTGRQLRLREPLYVDGENRIYGQDRDFIGNYADLANRSSSTEYIHMVPTSGPAPVSISHHTISSKKNIYINNGEQYEKIGEEADGRARLRNIVTGEIKIMDLANFYSAGNDIQEYRSNQPSRTFKNNRKVIFNGEEYMDLGYLPSSKEFKLLNLRTNALQRVPRTKYNELIKDSFGRRLFINGTEYEYQGTSAGKVNLRSVNNPDDRLSISEYEFRQNQQANFQKFDQALLKEISNSEAGYKMTVVFQGEQYQELGVDSEGRHRLYNPRTKKTILLGGNEFRNLSKSSRRSTDNLLLLQSAVGNNRATRLEQKEPGEMKLESETSNLYIFEGEKGSKIFIPKESIDVDVPIQVDQQDNIRQNGRLILTRQESRRVPSSYRFPNTTSKMISRGPSGYVQTKSYASNQNIQLTSARQLNQEFEKEQVSAGDVINPNRYYKILGIPQTKIKDFEFSPNDIYLTEKNIRGSDVMNKVEIVQDKYPHLAILVKGESDESEEYWLS